MLNQCLNCDVSIEDREGRKFCSRSCAATFNNKKFPKRQKEGLCEICLCSISATRKFCGRVCQDIARSKKPKKSSPQTRSKAVVDWRQRAKLRAIAYKGSCCQRCGYDRCANALDFHHIDPAEKEFAISRSIRSWVKMMAELDKCLLLCSNCHREFHAGLWNTEEIIPRSFNRQED